MLKAILTIEKFLNKGEKSGWTYIELLNPIAQKINPGIKTSYQVKGTLDGIEISGMSLLPMGNGNFILALNQTLLKKINKKVGDPISIVLELDNKPYEHNRDFLEFLETDERAFRYFQSLPKSHQKYFSKWIDSAKTIHTKVNRIAEAVQALSKHWGYAEMIRAKKKM